MVSNIPVPLVAPVMLLFYPVISHEWEKNRIVITTRRTCPWL